MTQTTYEETRYLMEEREIRSGNRERVEEERWTRGRPIGSTRYTPLSERIPVQRVVEDYRRTDYRYNDHVPTRHPSSTQTYHDHSAQDTRSSYRDSRIDSKGVTVVSRPGSPGPVAGAGDVINTPHGFTIQLDVKLFRPEQIKIVLTEDLLCVSGERIEVGAGGQTLKRSFARKYCIPPDIHLDSVRSHLDHNGVLIINGSRRGWRETHINIHPHGYGDRRSNSLISTV
ncbi:hypothetical protein RB195_010415 [Necator americanus]|uniref:SHSP domain-containing protein n=1 Tax=Necator americanus TaxID=51031 RepID=A0ABR1CXU2_NECAM